MKVQDLTEKGLALFCSSLINYPNLQTFKLETSVKLGKKQFVCIGSALAQCKNLQTLSIILSQVKVKAQDAQGLVSSLRNSVSLQQLSLDFNNHNFGEKGTQAVSSALKKLTNLLYLNLNLKNNNIGQLGFSSLISNLQCLENLKTLILKISRDSISKKIESLSFLSSLKNLQTLQISLPSNDLDDNCAAYLSPALKSLTQLTNLSLKLGSNQIGDNGLKALNLTFKDCTNLQSLSLDIKSHLIGSQGFASFSFLKDCSSLSSLKLKLDINEDDNNATFRLGRDLTSIKNLKSLSLQMNDFMDIDQKSQIDFFSHIAGSQSLIILSLDIMLNISCYQTQQKNRKPFQKDNFAYKRWIQKIKRLVHYQLK
ncbi:kinase domain protein (macronuclear) [Tetrahymena thermophila SB210]|uniref:Kinase domain protein n=1 Tax=Tetrahymena thermophila (strain SB210) TaxID=312017 RepID=I7M169_TETTS|nr:kinase domain protein [Tetrahymena thermophila SB210]EAR95056.2 kinase domain protein [Tetrahymena thermophila SB210]|eukprot:XP_001015301.2 kinase domain protein [Tetrahymena thermophila SB210]